MGRKRQPGQAEGPGDWSAVPPPPVGPPGPLGPPGIPPPNPAAGLALAAVQGLMSNPALATQNPALAQLLANPTMIQGLAAAGAAATASAAANVPALTIDPDVQELCDYFNIEERHARRLSDLMRKRPNTFEADLARLYDVLERAHSPPGLLTVKMREMEEGTFIGKMRQDKTLKEIIRKFKLDDQAESKLADILGRFPEERRLQYYDELERHLEVSNQPSAMTMMLLKKLGANQPLGKPGRVAPGSYLDRKNKEAEARDRRGGGDRNRDRDRDRDRDRERDRDRRSRSRSRRR